MKEIERKFLVDPAKLPPADRIMHLKQAYLSADPARIVRIRIEDDHAVITFKGKMTGIARPEFEYTIPRRDAEEIMTLALYPPIEKIRHFIDADGLTWEVDEFLGENLGLWIAEIELEDENQPFIHPGWLGKEVTFDNRYYNNELSILPYSRWPQSEKS